MEKRIIIFYVLLFSSNANLFRINPCIYHNVKSDVEGERVCKNEYDEYGNYVVRCVIEYPIVKRIISCSHTSISILEHANYYVDRDADYSITLNVTDSNITVLETSIFEKMEKLTTLYLENSNIQKIIPGAFNFLDNLQELYLDGNQLTTISDGLFNSLTLLEKLELSRNQIQDISDHAFKGVKLIELHLHHNNIFQMEQMLLDSLTFLKTLDISWNNLNNITNLNNLPLNNLNLSHNIIDTVNFECFPGELSKINLSFNSISEIINFNESQASEILLDHNNIKHFEKNENVEILNLSYNELETITKDLFGATLKRFDGGSNLISKVDADAFFGLHELQYLLLNNNSLSSIPYSCFKDLDSLMYLNLSRNKLTSFTFGTFDNLQSLEVLDISYNNLKDLNQNTFHALANLTDFLFQNNEISDINIDDLKLHMSNLRVINLDGNVWSCIKLVDIVHKLKPTEVSFPDGNYWHGNNVHGVKCYETVDRAAVDESSKSATNIDYRKLNSFFNEDFTKTIMYKYFNKDFKDSNFFKYLESLINATSKQNFNVTDFTTLLKDLKYNSSDAYNKDFKQSAMYSYFNKDFKNSAFFKYLENFKSKSTSLNNSEKIIDSKLEEAIHSIKEILESNFNKSLNFNESEMYKNFKEDLINFFKHMESLSDRTVENNFQNFNESKVEKFVSVPEVGQTTTSNTGLLSFILVFLIVNTCVLVTKVYLNIFHNKKYGPPKKEEVELI